MTQEIEMSRMVVTVEQDGNTSGTTEEVEQMTIIFEHQPGMTDDNKPFIVIKTNGWSIDDASDLNDLMNTVTKANSKILKGLA